VPLPDGKVSRAHGSAVLTAHTMSFQISDPVAIRLTSL
jgi:hypothetical protein